MLKTKSKKPMLKFFRKIRHNLVTRTPVTLHMGETGKTLSKSGRYLLYAFGEIILVVIGILIALQINNWNQEVQKNKQETIYYCKIIEDLNNDQRNIQRSVKSLNDRLASANALLTNLYKLVDDKSIIINDFIPSIRSYQFIPSKAAIDDITSSGKLENLKNVQLKAVILQHYSDLEYAMNVLSQNQQDFSKLSYRYEDMVALGYHQIPLYKDFFGNELLKEMPNINWQKDRNSILFKQFQEHITMSIIVGAREKELLKDILSSTELLESKLQPFCQQVI
jgi:hypothetical protein